MRPIKILLADDHTLFRQGLISLLEKQSNVKVVGEAGNGRETLDKVSKLNPDIVLLDIGMPGLSGLDVIPHIKKINPNTKILILSMYENEEYLYRSLKSGACGYVLKKVAPRDLISSIEAADAGQVYLSPSISTKVVERYLKYTGPDIKDSTYFSLTNREREILRLLAQGKHNKEISRLLDISYRTVETHRANIMKKLNVHTLADLITFAIRSGIIRTDEPTSS
jgi:DNA-binding NarL/FixJ family response regulator